MSRLFDYVNFAQSAPLLRADANKAVGKRVGDIFGDMVWVTTGWAEVGTFSTRLDVQVGLDKALFSNGDYRVKERH